MRTEYWVVRVLPVLTHAWKVRVTYPNTMLLASIRAGLDNNRLALLPDNSIAEAVEGFYEEEKAHERRAWLADKMPGRDFRVIMTADLAAAN